MSSVEIFLLFSQSAITGPASYGPASTSIVFPWLWRIQESPWPTLKNVMEKGFWSWEATHPAVTAYITRHMPSARRRLWDLFTLSDYPSKNMVICIPGRRGRRGFHRHQPTSRASLSSVMSPMTLRSSSTTGRSEIWFCSSHRISDWFIG